MFSPNLVNYPLIINSKNRINQDRPSSSSTFKITDLTNMQSKKNIFVSVPYVHIPPTWYNITSKNNSLTVIEATNLYANPNPLTVSIPPGNYNVNSLMSALTSALTTASIASAVYSNTYTASYNSSTGKMTISIGVSAVKTFTYEFVVNDLKNFIGFDNSYNDLTVPFPAQLTPAQNLNTYESPNPVNFINNIPALYIRSNILKTNSAYDTSTDSLISNVLKIVPITGSGLSEITLNSYEGLESQRFELTPYIFNSDITFTLTTDDRNNLVDLNGYDWEIILLIQYSK